MNADFQDFKYTELTAFIRVHLRPNAVSLMPRYMEKRVVEAVFWVLLWIIRS